MKKTVICLSLSCLTAGVFSLKAEEGPRLNLDYRLYAEGRYVYERHCMVCHGARGDGKGELAEGTEPKPRSFREGLFKFRTTPWEKMPADDDLRKTIRGGLSGTAMGMFTNLREEEVTAVIEYVKSFSRRWRQADNYADPVPLPKTPDWVDNREMAAAHAEKGKLFYDTLCALCHGSKGDGQGEAAKVLKDVWGFPAKPADLRQGHLRIGDRAEDIFRVLTTGLNGTPMASFAEVLTEEHRWQVAVYVRDRLRGTSVE